MIHTKAYRENKTLKQDLSDLGNKSRGPIYVSVESQKERKKGFEAEKILREITAKTFPS